MDQTWEILGLIIAVLMVITGLRLLLKKPQTLENVTAAELPVDPQSQQPIVPRHLRQFEVQDDHSEVLGDNVPEAVPAVLNPDADSESSFADRQQQFDFDAVEAEPEPATVTEIEETLAAVEQQQVESSTAVIESIEQNVVLNNADDVTDSEATEVAPDEQLPPVEAEIDTTDIDNAAPTQPTVVEPADIPSEVIFVEQRQSDVLPSATVVEQDISAVEPSATVVEQDLTDLAQPFNEGDTAEQHDNSLADIEQQTTEAVYNQALAQVETTIEQEQMVAVDMVEQAGLVEESSILDAHLSEQSRQDEESVLATAAQLVALYLYPSPKRALSGEKTLKMLIKYGLRYGEMSCFHRYEDNEQSSPLMFSVLRISDDGAPTGFDLETLSSEEVKGLAFFLALPNANAIKGFDMMVSLAGLMARDVDGILFDEQSLELTPQLRDHWRHFVIEYKPE